MEMILLKSKIHRATVTEANVDYVGSITIDQELMEASGIREYEQVHVLDIDNANRLVTYAIKGKRNSGTICLNGAAAKLVSTGDKVIIMSYCNMDEKELASFCPKIVIVDDKNKIITTKGSEEHGQYV